MPRYWGLDLHARYVHACEWYSEELNAPPVRAASWSINSWLRRTSATSSSRQRCTVTEPTPSPPTPPPQDQHRCTSDPPGVQAA